jgi:hypothetical protein
VELIPDIIIFPGAVVTPLPFLRPEESGAVCGTMFVDGLVIMRASRRMESSRLLAVVIVDTLPTHPRQGK